jgi:hypothetical protein
VVYPCSDRISRVPPYSRTYRLSTGTGLSPTMANLSRFFPFLPTGHWPGPRSLATTNGVSFDVLSSGYLDVSVPQVSSLSGDLTVGFPHSEILGSKLIRSSPRLIAAYYVLHRLHAPRHPLDTLKALDRSHYRCPYRTPNPLLKDQVKTRAQFDRSDQINQISRACSVPLPGLGSNGTEKHLFTMLKDPAANLTQTE